MRKTIYFSIMFLLLTYYTQIAEGSHYDWTDGGTHTCANITFNTASVSTNTTLNILDYGVIDPGLLGVYDTSKVNVLSTTAKVAMLNAFSESTINITNGTVGLNCWGSSKTIVSGGLIKRGEYGREVIPVFESSKLEIHGGSFINDFALSEYATLKIYGSDFAVNGIPYSGEIYSLLGGLWDNEPVRRLTGMLDNGGAIDNDFYIGGSFAKIVLIPEPCTLLLLGLGGMMLRNKK